MKVTVLMTYYNKGPYVEEAVRSVLNGTFRDFELLVVDDASTDDGLDRIRAIGDPRIRILESAVNTGRAAAANRGFDAARGEYIAVLDADDRMIPERLQRQVTYMDQHPEIGASGGYLMAFGAVPGCLPVLQHDAEARVQFLFGMPVFYSTCIIRRQVLDSGGVRCNANWRLPGMDRLFMLDLARHTRLANLPEVLTEYRRGEQNMRHGRDPWADDQELVAEVLRGLGFALAPDAPELLLMLKGLRSEAIDVPTLRRMHALIRELQEQNRKLLCFDPKVLQHDLARRWDGLYHDLPDRDPQAAWTHAALTRPLPIGRLRYLLLMRVKRALDLMLPRRR
jgi:glycosyltransferase involved in cell wall biosynthesis